MIPGMCSSSLCGLVYSFYLDYRTLTPEIGDMPGTEVCAVQASTVAANAFKALEQHLGLVSQATTSPMCVWDKPPPLLGRGACASQRDRARM